MSPRKRVTGGLLSLVLLAGTLVGGGGGSAVAAAGLPPGFDDQIVFSGLIKPTNIEFSPDGRIFVAEKSGLVKVFDNLADNTPDVFADLRSQVSDIWDRGMTGLALAPNFPTDPWVYVLYAYDAPPGQTVPYYQDGCPTNPQPPNPNCTTTIRLSRLQASPTGNAMVGAEQQVLWDQWCDQMPVHTAGDVKFGPDGMLYVTAGEGASPGVVDYGQLGTPPNPCGDPVNEGGALRAQDIRTDADAARLDGALLRLDPATGAAAAGNPNIGSADLNKRRIVAYGLRNAFRFTFRPTTNEVWLGDIGWNTWEEIDRLVNPTASPVTNFGWPCYEGAGPMPGYANANLPLCNSLYPPGGGHTPPYYTYNHAAAVAPGESCRGGGDAITGTAFYPTAGGPYPARFAGALFFADYSRGCIWAMKPTSPGGLPAPGNIELLVPQTASPVDLELGPGGELYYVDVLGGTVRRVRYYPSIQPPTAVVTANPLYAGTAPFKVNFSGTSSTDPDPADAGGLTYKWDFTNDGTWDAFTPTTSFNYNTAGKYVVKMRVTDTAGLYDEETVTLFPGDNPPVPVIDTPAAGATWRVGETITFSGHATDPDETIPASALSWEVRIQHCETQDQCHTHVLAEGIGGSSGSFTAIDHDYPSYLELALTATDSKGFARTVVRRLDPKTVQLTFRSRPLGVYLSVGGFTGRTPFTREVIQGSANSVSATNLQPFRRWRFSFDSWSDGGAQNHVIVAPSSPTTYWANYEYAGSLVPRRPPFSPPAPPAAAATTTPMTPTTPAGPSTPAEQPIAPAPGRRDPPRRRSV